MQYKLFNADEITFSLLAGVDEAGRGPLAGSVYAAAVILDENKPIEGLDDSKKLSASKREALAIQIKEQALDWHIAFASVQEIDSLNILQATMLAMRRACEGLRLAPEIILIDGNQIPKGLMHNAQAVVKGDTKHKQIAAASILAKTARDEECNNLHLRFPLFGFNKHKGYATKEHIQNLHKHGPCKAHRKSFAPIKHMISQEAVSD